MKICKVDNCNGILKYSNLGYCKIHYDRYRRYGRINLLEKTDKNCLIKDCQHEVKGLGLCMMHYKRQRKYGDATIRGSDWIGRSIMKQSTKNKLAEINRNRVYKKEWTLKRKETMQRNPYKMSEENKLLLRSITRGKYAKDKHWNWKGGISPVRMAINGCFEYKAWRTSILQRDNYTCVICNQRGGLLEVDHYPKSFAQILRDNNIQSLDDAIKCNELWDIENNRTLCEACHRETPNYGGRGILKCISTQKL